MQGTRVFTVASGNPSSDGVVAGDYAAIDNGGATAVYIARVSTRDATTITLVASGLGTAPANGTVTLRIGGAWKGPNAAEAWPFGQTLTGAGFLNAAGNVCRVNFKNDATYAITTGITHSVAGPQAFQGYTSSYGDGGMATLDGSTNAILLLNLAAVTGTINDFIFSNNGSSGTNSGLNVGAGRWVITRCVAHDIRGHGFATNTAGNLFVECEAYNCNSSNTAALAGFFCAGGAGMYIRCVAHDNSGSNNNGFRSNVNGAAYIHCIADTNGLHGFSWQVNGGACFINCDAYNNGGDGLNSGTGGATLNIESCNFVKNAGYGINVAAAAHGNIANCGYGSGTQVNTSGPTSIGADSSIVESGAVTYASNLTPWVDPANGDFRISLAAAKGTGRGTFTQTAASYTGTIGYPDIGAAQHLESPGGSYTFVA